MSVSVAQIHAELTLYIGSDKHVTSVFTDSEYNCPTEEWVVGDFASGLKSLVSQLGMTYTEQTWDCDNFARFAWGYASFLHWKTRPLAGTGLGFGLFAYRTDSGLTYHMLNLVLDNEFGRVVPWFFEPQTFFPKLLTQTEVASCVYYLL